MLRNPLGGILFVAILYFGSLFGLIFVLGPCVPLMFLKPKWYRWFNDKFTALMPYGSAGLLELVYDVKVIISGDIPIPGDAALTIMNHRCHFDWMFYWSVVVRHGSPSFLKIVMKEILRYVPGIGWGLQCGVYPFLKRNWEQDEAYLNTLLDYYCDMEYPLQLLLFPEGTNLDELSQPRSDSYARKNNLPLYKHVLHPRTRGFVHCLEKLRKGTRRLDAIYDVTIAYDQDYCYKEKDLLRGNFPKEIHFEIKRYSINEMPEDYPAMEEWLRKRWIEKEECLTKFYLDASQGFPSKCEVTQNSTDKIEKRVKIELFLTIFIFLIIIVLGCFLLYRFVYARWFFCALVIFYVLLCVLGFGMDKFQLWIHDKIGKKERHST